MNVRSRGFSMIEIAVVVATVAILAMVAIPKFGDYAMRVRQAERPLMSGHIAASVLLYTAANDKWPPGTNPDPDLFTPGANPPGDPSGTRRTWASFATFESWLLTPPTTQVYHTYRPFGSMFGEPYFTVEVWGDLDGDDPGDSSGYSKFYTYYIAEGGTGLSWERSTAIEDLLRTGPHVY